MIYSGENYEVMGKIREICLVLNTDTIYVLAKLPKTREKAKYHFLKIKYDMDKDSTKMCEEITINIANNIVSLLIYIYVLCIIVSINIIFIAYLLLTYYILFDRIFLRVFQLCWREFII